MLRIVWKIKIIILFFIICSLAIITSQCINLDPDALESCGKTYYESEANENTAAADNFNIMLKKDCTVKIKGTLEGGGSDYFRINSGNAYDIKITLEWSNGSNIDFYILDYETNQYHNVNSASSIQASTLALDSGSILEYELFYLNLDNVGGTPNYTITIKGSSY